MSHQAWINDISEEDRLSILQKHPRAIIHINSPSFNELKMVIDLDVDALKEQTIMCGKAQLYFIRRYPDMIYIIKDPLPIVLDIAIEKFPHAITQVDNFSDDQLIRAITMNPKVIDSFSPEKRKKIEGYIETYATLVK